MLWSSILVVLATAALFQWAMLVNARRLTMTDRNARVAATIISFALIAIGVGLVVAISI